MDLLAVDPTDRAAFEHFYRLRADVRKAEHEFPVGLGLEEAWVLFSGEHSDVRIEGLAAVDGDTWLGMAWLDWWLQENTDSVDVEIVVAAEHRRRGVASFLLDAVVERAQQEGRRLLSGMVMGDAVSARSSGTAFAERRGFVQRHSELMQVLELPVPEERLVSLEQRIAGERAARDAPAGPPLEYRLIQWREHTPDEWLDQFADALSVMTEEVPSGDLEVQPSRWTPGRIREMEDRRRKQGRFCHTTVAVAPDGQLAAYTQMGGAASSPERLYQWDTLVRPEHRGRRLGMAVKIANLRSLQGELDRPAVLRTWNAPENAAMIAVNDRLGFRPVARRSTWQREL